MLNDKLFLLCYNDGDMNNMPKPIKTVEQKSYVKNSIWRLGITLLAFIIEIVALIFFANRMPGGSPIQIGEHALGLFLVLYIYNQRKTSSLKVPWIILILLFPIIGAVIYLVTGNSGTTRHMRRRYEKIDKILYPLLPDQIHTVKKDLLPHQSISNLSKYLHKYAFYPMYDNSDIEFFPYATDAFEEQKRGLAGAEHFIFMEYHAIEDAEAFKQIEEILIDRVKHGVEVRLFYDDMGSIAFINKDFNRRMEKYGIQCRVFNPVTPFINLFLNNRDHRKITVIDGKIAFTGGFNIANEYFNITHPYGFWKDTGVKITGEATKSFTVMFLEMWNAIRSTDDDDIDIQKYLPNISYKAKENCFIQPYADNPIDNEQVGENVYIGLIERAEKYIYFCTPYLIITDEMTHALCLAAKRGVEVIILTPGIPDKKIVYRMTRANYRDLVLSGVKIFEYTPGFCHAKQCVSDDIVATCGTINLDYRSLYHHFEDGCLIYNAKAVLDIKDDFERTFNVSREVTHEYGRRSFRFSLWCLVMKLFSPLL